MQWEDERPKWLPKSSATSCLRNVQGFGKWQDALGIEMRIWKTEYDDQVI